MKISILNNLKSLTNETEQVWLELGFLDSQREISFLNLEISKDHILNTNFIEIKDDAFEICKKIQFRIKTKHNTFKTFPFASKQKALFLEDKKQNIVGVKQKENSPFANDPTKYFEEVNAKILETNKTSDKKVKGKNLIYYSLYFESPYLHLLNFSVETLLKYSTEDFDLLIITDEQTKPLIENLSFTSTKSPLFHITPSPFDGIEASINKLKIFEYKDIDKYENILYLDCDTIATGNLLVIFNEKLKNNTLYTAYNKHLTFDHFKTIQHGFETLDDTFVKEMETTKQMPFNAGQFLFKNSAKMKEHFKNVLWMVDNSFDSYFFEQSFMNYYFCKAGITECSTLQKQIDFVVTTDLDKINIKTGSSLVHFISPPLDGEAKLKMIYKFI